MEARRDLERMVHNTLFENIHVLTLIYPTTSEFDKHFHKDMFVKNNKAAFHEVIYYLLNILNPVAVKEKITTWPIYDVKSESQFRNEIMRYINELNAIYEHADIPAVVKSHLISPGGYRFANFMLQVSQLVLFEHLRKDVDVESELLYPMKPNKNPEIAKKQLAQLEALTSQLQSTDWKLEFETAINNYKKQASSMLKHFEELKDKKAILQNKLQHMKISTINPSEFDACLLKVSEEVDEISETSNKLEHIAKLILSKEETLEYNPGEINIPLELRDIVDPNSETLDVAKLLKSFTIYLNREISTVNAIDVNKVQLSLDQFREVEIQLGYAKERFNSTLAELQSLLDSMNTVCVTESEQDQETSEDSTALAIPLEDSGL